MHTTRTRRILAALSVGAGLIAAGTTFAAQTAPRQLPTTPQQSQAAPAPDRQADRPNSRFENRIERRLDFLHYEIRITDAQQRLWDNFAAAVRDEAQQVRDRVVQGPGPGPGRERGPDGRMADNGRRGPPSVVERLEQRQQRLANQTTRVDRLLGTLRPLYAALDANQKRTADRLLFQQDFNGRGPGRFAMNGRFGRGFERDYR